MNPILVGLASGPGSCSSVRAHRDRPSLATVLARLDQARPPTWIQTRRRRSSGASWVRASAIRGSANASRRGWALTCAPGSTVRGSPRGSLAARRRAAVASGHGSATRCRRRASRPDRLGVGRAPLALAGAFVPLLTLRGRAAGGAARSATRSGASSTSSQCDSRAAPASTARSPRAPTRSRLGVRRAPPGTVRCPARRASRRGTASTGSATSSTSLSSELAASVALAGDEGARVRASIAAKARAIRIRGAHRRRRRAQAASERMSLPIVLLMVGFVVFLGYPAVIPGPPRPLTDQTKGTRP